MALDTPIAVRDGGAGRNAYFEPALSPGPAATPCFSGGGVGGRGVFPRWGR